MKILLIYPYCLEDRHHAEDVSVVPIGLFYVGALLKAESYDVQILNWYHIHTTPQKIVETLSMFRPDIIGFSILHANRWGGIEIARIAKGIDKRIKVVFGGIGATFLWKHLLTRIPEVDFVVMGEGEYTFLALVRAIENGKEADIASIRGVALRKSGNVLKTEPADGVINLDALPDPAIYFTYQHVSSSRGCPGACTFCGSPRFWGQKIRFHSPGYFVAQLERLNKNGINFFYFSDDTFTLKKYRAIEICKKICESRLPIAWAAISRVNTVDEDILHWMRKAGCIQISYGVESGSSAIRKRLNKHITTEQIKRAFSLTTRFGIFARAYFIYGCPGETETTINETMALIREIKPMSTIFYILDLFPGTELYSDFEQSMGVTDDIWLNKIEDIMYWETDPRLSKDQILEFGKKLRSDFYSHLPGFTDEIELIDRPGFSVLHADFLSRLALTFTHGDYAEIKEIGDKQKTAEKLFHRALQYAPDHRAYLGLAIIKQQQGAYRDSIPLLEEGITHFPNSESLHICLGLSQMNLGHYHKAVSCFRRYPDAEGVRQYCARCYHELGEFEKEARLLEEIQQLE